MKRTPLTSNLTKAFIESNIPQEKIMAKYLNLDVNVIKKCIETNTLITSVFRDNDTNSSMGFAYNKHGKLKVRDFGGAGQFMDIYDTVAYVLSISYERPINTNNKRDFYFILTHIYKTFSKEIDDKKYKEKIDNDIIYGLSKIKHRRPIIELVPRSWNKYDKEYWSKLGVSLSYLNTHFVIPIEQYYIDRGVNTDPKYYYKQKDPCYAYMLGQDRKGVHLIKLYFPNRDRKTDLKFITNCNVLEGLPNLELNKVDSEIKNALIKVKKRRPIIELVPRSWNKFDKEYWNNLGVSLGYLNTHFVIPVEQYYIDRGVDTEPKYYYKQKDPCYAYMLGQNRAGIHFIKLYFPKRNRTTELKFITNCNVLEGLLNLELNNYDYILITKSSKDRLSIGSHLDMLPFYGGAQAKLNIGIVNLPCEGYHLTEKEYSWLTNKLAPNGKIISLLDFDYTGRMGAKYMYDNYNIPYLFITRGEFGLPNYGCKDFAELHDKYTIKEINKFINETETYVKLRFGIISDTTSDLSRLPYFE